MLFRSLLLLGLCSLGAAPAAPKLLSQFGLYVPGTATVEPANLSSAPQYPLWSDGADKARWAYLPPGQAIDTTDGDAWPFPVGTRFWKQFSCKGKKVETRLLWRASPKGWVYATYAWNPEQTTSA